ncbi:unnamed protein product, partial [Brassica rapa subsp. narinosa]
MFRLDVFSLRFGAEGCFNHLGVLHVQVISCSLYGDDD